MGTNVHDKKIGIDANQLIDSAIAAPLNSSSMSLEYITRLAVVLKAVVGASTAGTAATNTDINATNDTILFTGRDWKTGRKGQFTISGGTLPGGLSLATDYWLIQDANNSALYKVANSLANALAGTAIDLTNTGTAGQTVTFTPTALAGANAKLQVAIKDEDAWYVDAASAQNITADALLKFELDDIKYRFARLVVTLTAGQLDLDAQYCLKG